MLLAIEAIHVAKLLEHAAHFSVQLKTRGTKYCM